MDVSEKLVQERIPVDELKPCPKCGRRPIFGYACGEYFIVGKHEGCPVCDNFGEMHATEEQEAEAWNRRTTNEMPL